MDENLLQIIAVCKLIWVSCFAALYGFGGISGKWKRRYVGPAWIGLGIWGFSMWTNSWNLVYLTYIPLLGLSLSLGYGASDFKDKLFKRSIYGLALGCAPIGIVIISHTWGLFAFHVSSCVIASVAFGVFNISKTARSEETLIATYCCLLPLYMI